MRGRSCEVAHEEALRAMMKAEALEGRMFLAGLALSYAANTSEIVGRRFAERVLDLRTEPGRIPDGQILVMLNKPIRLTGPGA